MESPERSEKSRHIRRRSPQAPASDDRRHAFTICDLVKTADEWFSPTRTFCRLYPLGLLSMSVLHPHSIEVVLRELSQTPLSVGRWKNRADDILF